MSEERSQWSNIPVPDPSTVTTERLFQLETQIRREVASTRELLESKLNLASKLSEERASGFASRLEDLKNQLDISSSSTKAALTIALNAQEKATDEAKLTFRNQVAMLEKNITEIKELIYRGEGKNTGIGSTIVIGISIVFGASGLIFGILGMLHR